MIKHVCLNINGLKLLAPFLNVNLKSYNLKLNKLSTCDCKIVRLIHRLCDKTLYSYSGWIVGRGCHGSKSSIFERESSSVFRMK